MKKFFNAIPRPWIGLYVLWVAVHFVLLLSLAETFTYKTGFWPFNPTQLFVCTPVQGSSEFGTRLQPITPSWYENSYDYTEFLIYLVLPILLFVGLYLMKPKSQQRA